MERPFKSANDTFDICTSIMLTDAHEDARYWLARLAAEDFASMRELAYFVRVRLITEG
jgi:hypothetical protein